MNSPTAIQTYTGIFFDPFNPQAELIRIEDIAHALTMQCRFSGHVRRRWSVAQHSLMVSDLCPVDLRLVGLLHDAAEAYVTDLPRPIKHDDGMFRYREIEARVHAAIFERFGLDWILLPDAVKEADNTVLVAEAYALKHGLEGWIEHKNIWGMTVEKPDPTLVLAIRNANPPSDEYIRDEFLQTFYALGGQ